MDRAADHESGGDFGATWLSPRESISQFDTCLMVGRRFNQRIVRVEWFRVPAKHKCCTGSQSNARRFQMDQADWNAQTEQDSRRLRTSVTKNEPLHGRILHSTE